MHLLFKKGLSPVEAAIIMGVRTHTVRSLKNKAIFQLKRFYFYKKKREELENHLTYCDSCLGSGKRILWPQLNMGMEVKF